MKKFLTCITDIKICILLQKEIKTHHKEIFVNYFMHGWYLESKEIGISILYPMHANININILLLNLD